MKLKVISTESEDLEKVIGSATAENMKHYFSGVYLHGRVQRKVGYDIVCLINSDDFEQYEFDNNPGGETPEMIEMTLVPEGIYECEVYGYENSCTAYVWTKKRGTFVSERGLIVDNTDEESVEFAKKKYEEKPFIL